MTKTPAAKDTNANIKNRGSFIFILNPVPFRGLFVD